MEKKKLKIWLPHNNSFIDEAIELFKESYPCAGEYDFVVEVIQHPHFVEAFTMALAAGTTPDVILMNNNDIMRFAEQGAFLEIDDSINLNDFAQGSLPLSLNRILQKKHSKGCFSCI